LASAARAVTIPLSLLKTAFGRIDGVIRQGRRRFQSHFAGAIFWLTRSKLVGSAGGAYVNFMMDEGEDRVRATYGKNYKRCIVDCIVGSIAPCFTCEGKKGAGLSRLPRRPDIAGVPQTAVVDSKRSSSRSVFAYPNLWNVGVFPASVRLDARELHHLAPFLGLFHDELAEVAG
jgi:hypothetical protein